MVSGLSENSVSRSEELKKKRKNVKISDYLVV